MRFFTHVVCISVVVIMLYPMVGTAQPPIRHRLDSVQTLVRQGIAARRADTGFVSLLMVHSWQYHSLCHCDTATALAWKAHALAKRLRFVSGEGYTLYALGVNHRFEDRYDSALYYFRAALHLVKGGGRRKTRFESAASGG
jgi:hypothetical protein